MKDNNPSKRLNVRKKISNSLKKRIKNMDAVTKNKFLQNWINAPKYRRGKITKPEKHIINLNIDGLKYVGNGSLWLTFKSGRHKNPDFIRGHHIVEVGDFHYWHTTKEKLEVINNYNDIGYKCLYLSSEEVFDKDIKTTIERFLQS